MERKIAPSELIINDDNSIFHLHIKPEMLCDNIILVGDPARVDMVASFFDEKTAEVSNREFHTICGIYRGKPIMCVSHGIGADNIDIVVNELDALANIDFAARSVRKDFRQLTMVRLGSSGSIQEDIPVGSMVVAEKALGIDGAFHFYRDSEKFRDIEFEDEFIRQCEWKPLWNHPYVVDADAELVGRIATPEMHLGVTITANGFYGPQGRELRLHLAESRYKELLHSFVYKGRKLTNFEMESAMLQGLAKLMGHKAVTICAIIAGRISNTAETDYHGSMEHLVETVLNRL